MVNFFFDGWQPIVRIVVVGTLGYVALITLLRVSGKRTLAQLNSFDFIITVALGASFGRILTARTVPLAEAVVAFALLVLLQYAVSVGHVRWRWFARTIAARPSLVAYDGHSIPDALRRERLTEAELQTAIRKQGYGSLEHTVAVVLESDGHLTVIGQAELGDASAVPQQR
jgi:uncharacterized membrane protein YcaP (DUF421 family)